MIATLATIPDQLRDLFRTQTREDGSEYVLVREVSALNESSRAWLLGELVRDWVRDDLHDRGSTLPSDEVYSLASDAAEAVADWLESMADDNPDPDDTRFWDWSDEAHEFADGWPSVYTHDLKQWLANYPGALDWMAQAIDEFGRANTIERDIALGAYLCARHAFDTLASALADYCAELGDDA